MLPLRLGLSYMLFQVQVRQGSADEHIRYLITVTQAHCRELYQLALKLIQSHLFPKQTSRKPRGCHIRPDKINE